eukprot:1161106-Pelagomonas_calceolata.AAC.11
MQRHKAGQSSQLGSGTRQMGFEGILNIWKEGEFGSCGCIHSMLSFFPPWREVYKSGFPPGPALGIPHVQLRGSGGFDVQFMKLPGWIYAASYFIITSHTAEHPTTRSDHDSIRAAGGASSLSRNAGQPEMSA